jgi:hypothetical protein
MGPKRKPPPNNERNVISLGDNIPGVMVNKCSELVQYESWQELAFCLRCERDPTVINYRSQPKTITYINKNGHKRRYTVDFQVWRSDGTIEFHEITVEERRENHESLREREEQATRAFAELDCQYIVETDEDLPSGFELENLVVFSVFEATCNFDEERANFWREKLRGQGKVSLMPILYDLEANPDKDLFRNTLYYMIWHGEIQIDWKRQFFWRGGLHTKIKVWIPEEGEK